MFSAVRAGLSVVTFLLSSTLTDNRLVSNTPYCSGNVVIKNRKRKRDKAKVEFIGI